MTVTHKVGQSMYLYALDAARNSYGVENDIVILSNGRVHSQCMRSTFLPDKSGVRISFPALIARTLYGAKINLDYGEKGVEDA